MNDKFKPTPEGFQQAQEYATKTGRIDKFNSIKDSYLQLHLANTWWNEEQN